MSPSRKQLRRLLEAVAATEAREINCEELLAGIGAYLESAAPDQALPPEFQLVEQHLSVCPECREEYEALILAHKTLPDTPKTP